MAKVKLHRCSIPTPDFAAGMHACQKVEKALKQQDIDYEVVHVTILPRSKRSWVIEATGQDRVPVIEFEDGSAYRAESSEMVERIMAGKLFESAEQTASPAGPAA
jgi:glutathione S-transferase